MIPTSSELLFTALLLAMVWISRDQPSVLPPRDWMRWREEEIDSAMVELEEQGPFWAAILGLSVSGSEGLPTPETEAEDWHWRASRLRGLIAEGKEKREEEVRRALREAPIDESKVAELEGAIRKSILNRRVIRHLFAAQGGLIERDQMPADCPELSSRHWLPKELLVADSHFIGLSTAARQLARAPLNGEVERLLQSLPDRDVIAVDEASTLPDELRRSFSRMRESGFQPTLVLAPVSWQLRHALGVSRGSPARDLASNSLVPPSIAEHFVGSFDGSPILVAAQVPSEVLWVVDLPEVARFSEWPSQGGSGVRLELETFSESDAQRLLIEKPEIAGEGDREQAVLRVQESVLLTQHICWRIDAREQEAAIAIEVPASLALKPGR